MSFRNLTISALLVLRLVTTIASPIGERADDELVKIPGGFVPKSNFHIVPEGGKVIHTPDLVQLLDANGQTLHSASLTASASVLSHLDNTGTSYLRARQDKANTSTVVASVEVPSVFSFTGTWAVPPKPRINSGQLLQYFVGLAPPSLGALLLPVLQYGVAANGGGPFWSLSTWYITGNQAFATNITSATRTTPFNPPKAFITKDNNITLPLPGVNIWIAGFTPNVAALQIQTVVGFNELMVALESTDVFLRGNLPNVPTDLYDISLQEGSSSSSSPSSIPWQITSDSDDEITMKVASASGVSGALQIGYVRD